MRRPRLDYEFHATGLDRNEVGALLVAASLPKWKEIFRGKFRPRDLAVGLAFVFSLVFIVTQIVIDCEYLNRTRYTTLAQDARGAGPDAAHPRDRVAAAADLERLSHTGAAGRGDEGWAVVEAWVGW